MHRFAVLSIVIVPFALFAACQKDQPAEPPPQEAAAPAPAPTPAAQPTQALAGGLPFDQNGSAITFVGSKVTGSHPGKFTRFSGSLVLNEADLTASKVSVEIDMASVVTDTEKLDGHLKSDDFFAAATHPKGTFVSTAITAGGSEGATHTIAGNLTLRGKTQPISIPATVTVTPTSVAVKGKVTIDRQKYGIAYPGAPDNLIRDDVPIELDLNIPRAEAKQL